VAMSNAEKCRRYRDRQRALAAVPDTDCPGHGIVDATDTYIEGLDAPNPALVAIARGLAVTLDGRSAVHAATAAELRRAIGALDAEQRRRGRGAGREGKPRRPVSALDQLRAARAAAERRR
jgi:hypothetical protein